MSQILSYNDKGDRDIIVQGSESAPYEWIKIKKRGSPSVSLRMVGVKVVRNVTLLPFLVRRPSSTLVLGDESVHLTPVAPPELPLEVSSCKAAGSTCMGQLQLPLLSINQLLLLRQVIESASLIPPLLQFGLETYIADPFHRVVDLFGEDMIVTRPVFSFLFLITGR